MSGALGDMAQRLRLFAADLDAWTIANDTAELRRIAVVLDYIDKHGLQVVAEPSDHDGCLRCGEALQRKARGRPAIFCSGACRKNHWRERNRDEKRQ